MMMMMTVKRRRVLLLAIAVMMMCGAVSFTKRRAVAKKRTRAERIEHGDERATTEHERQIETPRDVVGLVAFRRLVPRLAVENHAQVEAEIDEHEERENETDRVGEDEEEGLEREHAEEPGEERHERDEKRAAAQFAQRAREIGPVEDCVEHGAEPHVPQEHEIIAVIFVANTFSLFILHKEILNNSNQFKAKKKNLSSFLLCFVLPRNKQ